MAKRTRRERWLLGLLIPAVVVGVTALAWLQLRTTLQIDKLRQESVVEATLSVANEKVDRVDKRIIEEDNVVLAEADPAHPADLGRRWLPTAARETPTVIAVVVIDLWSPGRDVVAYASRTGGGPDDDVFRRLVVARAFDDLDRRAPFDELRHLHKRYDGQGYLFSYAQRFAEGRPYLVVAWHDVRRIVRELLPALIDAGPTARVNVVDEDGRVVVGPPLRAGEAAVVRPFPTTLYGWRLQATLTSAEELGARVGRRRMLETSTVILSCIVIMAGLGVTLYAAERERRVSELKSDFVANVSHELKTPLALVRMFSELLLTDRVPSDAKRREYLQIIQSESERLSALIENVLDFAKLERDTGAFELSEDDVGEAVSRAVEVYRYRAEREAVAIDLEVDEGLPQARIDARAIGLAVINLLDNAIKYARSGKHIGVSVRGARGRIEIRVADQGPGISVEDRKRIFERFVRGKDSGGERGSGIGLALVKHIADVHGGRTWVESEPGQGATFVIELPIAKRPSVARIAATRTAEPS